MADAIPAREDWLVPTIVQLELAKWLAREVGEDKADQVIAFTQMCHVVPLDTQTALAAADICGKHKLATADAIIYATAPEPRRRPRHLRRPLRWPARRDRHREDRPIGTRRADDTAIGRICT